MATPTDTPQNRALHIFSGFESHYEREVAVPRSTFSIDMLLEARPTRSTAFGALRWMLARRFVVVEYFADRPTAARLASATAKVAILAHEHYRSRRVVADHAERPPALLAFSHGAPLTTLRALGARPIDQWLWRWDGFGPCLLVDLSRLPGASHPAFDVWQPFGLLTARTGPPTGEEILTLLANDHLLQSDKEALLEPMSQLDDNLPEKPADESFGMFFQRVIRERDEFRAAAEAERAAAEAERAAQGELVLRATLNARGIEADDARISAVARDASPEQLADLVARLASGKAVPELE